MIGAQFFTTINFGIFIDTLKLLTYKLPYLRFGNEQDKLEQEFKQYLNATESKIYSFYNGRSALYHALKSLNFPAWTDILVSSYTCVSVVNTILQAWYNPVYVDIDESLNMTLSDAKNKKTQNTKAIIVQHTFWNPANMFEFTEWAHKENLVLIEDVAHWLGGEIWWKKLWTFGDMAIFSTWRDKVISSVTWWFLLVNNDELEIKRPNLIPVSRKLALQNLFYNIIAYLAWKTYDIKLWKVLMYLANKLKLIPPILTPNEKACNFQKFFYQLPNSLAYLARKQLKQVDKINQHRIKLANKYKSKLKDFKFPNEEKFAKNIYFWVPVILENKKQVEDIVKRWRKSNIYFGIYWTGENIVPQWTNLENCKYKKWTCPNAENLSKRILILPNHYQVKSIDKILEVLQK